MVTVETFVRARGPALVRFAYALCGDRHLAQDLVQEALARCARRWDRIDGAPEAYVRKAVARELISWRRRRSHGERPGPIPDRPGLGHDDLAARDEVWRAMATLPRRQRAVLVLRHYEALPDAEIAELLGVSRGTVRSLAARAAASLRAHPQLAYLAGAAHGRDRTETARPESAQPGSDPPGTDREETRP